MEGWEMMNEIMICILCLAFLASGIAIACQFQSERIRQDSIIIDGLRMDIEKHEGTIKAMEYIIEERKNSIRSYKGANTKYREEVALLKKDLVNQKMWFAAYVSKKENEDWRG